jgi:hypothetical protein
LHRRALTTAASLATHRLARRSDEGARSVAGFGASGAWYPRPMLYTILIILAIIALLMFIFGRSRVR